MLHRKLAQYCVEQRPVWVFLKDQQCWLEDATVVDVDSDLVTFRYEEEDDEADEPELGGVCADGFHRGSQHEAGLGQPSGWSRGPCNHR